MGTINEAVIAAYVNPSNSSEEHTDNLNQILLAFHQKKVTLPQLVQFLGEHLTNLDELVRSRGTLLLSEVLTRLPTYPLDANAVHFLVGFFTDRIQDYPCVGEVLKGVVALLRNHTLAEPDAELIIRTVFQEVQPQALPQSQRKMVLDTIELVLQKHLNTVKSMQSDFVYGVLQMIDGEKDPRNLVVAFRIFCTTIREIPGHARFTEDLFEVVSCYFPISFKPRADDPDAISLSTLVSSLRQCLVATPEFAPLCLPFLLDKMQSSSADAKIESMLTLEACVESFGSKVSGPFLADIWGALRAEVLTGKEAEVVEQGLATIKALTRILSTDIVQTSSSSASDLSRFLSPLVSDSAKQLSGPADSKLASISSRILSNAASASVPACAYVVDNVLPTVFAQLNESSSTSSTLSASSRQSLLEVLPALLSASKNAVPVGYSPHPLSAHAKDLHEHLSLALLGGSPSTLSSSVLGLTALSLLSLSFPSLLSREAVFSIVGRITAVAADSDSCADAGVRSRSVDSLVAIARAAPDLVLEHSLPVLLQRVRLNAATALTSQHAPSHAHTASQEHSHDHDHAGHNHSHDHAGHNHSHDHSGHSHNHAGHSHGPSPGGRAHGHAHSHPHGAEGLYAAISALCVAPAIFNNVTFELLGMIQQLLREDAKLPVSDGPINVATAQHHAHPHDQAHTHARAHQKQAEQAFVCLADALSKNTPERETIAQLCSTFIPGIIAVLIELVTTPSPSGSGYHRSAQLYLPHCLRIVRTVVQQAEDDIQLELFNKVTGIHVFLLLCYLFDNLNDIFLRGAAAPFNPSSGSVSQTQLIVIYANIISQAKTTVIGSLPISDITTALLGFASNPLVATPTSQCVASIVNKVSEGEFLSKFLDQTVDNLLVSTIQSTSAPHANRAASLRTLVWILKALVQRDHPTWRGIVAVIINLVGYPGGQQAIENEEISEIASNSFDILLADSFEDGFLSKQSGAVIRVLYKQKFFTVVYPQLLESFKATTSFLYLVAIGNLLRHIPRPVLLAELPTIIPLLIQSLRHPSTTPSSSSSSSPSSSSADSQQASVLQTSSASTILMLLKEAPDSISEHASTFITELLHLCVSSPFADVRAVSLKCIAKFATLPFIKIFPHKANVTSTLQKCLDDKKRIVRREAVKARNQWFVLSDNK